MYEMREHRRLDEAVSAEEIAYMKKISEDKPLEEKAKDKVVEIYQSEDKIQNISEK